MGNIRDELVDVDAIPTSARLTDAPYNKTPSKLFTGKKLAPGPALLTLTLLAVLSWGAVALVWRWALG